MVRRIIIAVLFLAAPNAAVQASNESDQPPCTKSVSKTTKVGMVNLTTLWTDYEKIKQLKNRFDIEKLPYQTQKDLLEKMIKEWTKALSSPDKSKLTEKQIDDGEQIVIDCRRKLEDLDRKFNKEVKRRYEKELAQLSREIDEKIREYAGKHGFHLVLAYGEGKRASDLEFTIKMTLQRRTLPVWGDNWGRGVEETEETVAEFRLKNEIVDQGGMVKLFAMGEFDISAEVLKLLNASAAAGEPVKLDEPKDSGNPAPASSPPVGLLTWTKVGVVNVNKVYAQYERVKQMNNDIERDTEPYERKKAELNKLIADWQKALSDPKEKANLSDEKRERGCRVIVECGRQLCDLEMDFAIKVKKKARQQAVEIHKEIDEAISSFAKAHGYQLLLGSGEPQEALPELERFQRQKKLIDAGGMGLVYSHPEVDVSMQVLAILNNKYRAK